MKLVNGGCVIKRGLHCLVLSDFDGIEQAAGLLPYFSYVSFTKKTFRRRTKTKVRWPGITRIDIPI